MKRRLAAFLCALVLLSSVSAAATGGLGAVFSRSRGYNGAFSDLAPELWYHDYAVALYEYGFTEGRGDGTFAGTAQVTLAELLTFSARVRAIYEAQGAAVEFPVGAEGEAWYAPYVAYLKEKNLLAEEFEGRYEAVATRAEMAGIFAKTLPAACYDDRNAALVTDGYALGQYILDVDDYTPYQWEILWLYKQGILNGTDERARFMPYASVTRAEVAAMLTRMVEPAARLSLEWNVLPYPSAVGARYEDFAVPPQSVNTAPAVTDKSAMDALVRDMIVLGKTKITLQYPAALTAEEAETLTGTAVSVAKTYGEQMYSRVRCTAYSTGQVELTFASACCTDAQLAIYRKDALAAAVAVHDALWESGYLYKSMSEYEKAKAYYIWLCENCAYDFSATDASPSHLAWSALVRQTAVCDGYVGAYNMLLKLEGIDCRALAGSNHAWTVAVLDGREYHIDPTWGDLGERADMSCFAMTAQQSFAKHPW